MGGHVHASGKRLTSNSFYRPTNCSQLARYRGKNGRHEHTFIVRYKIYQCGMRIDERKVDFVVDDVLSSAKQTMNKANDTSIVMRPHQGRARIRPMTVAHSFPFLSASQPTTGDAESISKMSSQYCTEPDGNDENVRKNSPYI